MKVRFLIALFFSTILTLHANPWQTVELPLAKFTFDRNLVALTGYQGPVQNIYLEKAGYYKIYLSSKVFRFWVENNPAHRVWACPIEKVGASQPVPEKSKHDQYTQTSLPSALRLQPLDDGQFAICLSADGVPAVVCVEHAHMINKITYSADRLNFEGITVMEKVSH